MEIKEATYQYLEEVHGDGMFFYTSCCGNRMYSMESDRLRYHGHLCPICLWKGKRVKLYLRGTHDGTRVENELAMKAESEVNKNDR